jgi:phage/plasmid primase-like uncharacterized protein
MTLPAEAIDRARDVPIEDELSARGHRLRCCGAEQIGPCPVCGGHDRFSVNPSKRVWNCRGCGKGGDVISLVCRIEGCTFPEAVEKLSGEAPRATRASPPRPRNPDPGEDADRNRRSALRIWNAARSIRGTLAETYLVRVRVVDADQIPHLDEVLRFEPDCPFGDDRSTCLIALVRDIITDAPKAIQRTALDAEGSKIDRRSLGPTRGGAIKLWGDAEVTQGLVIGEGLETTASAATRVEHHGTLLRPAWSLIDRSNLRDFPVLAGIEALTILVDNDGNGAGQSAARDCAKRWAAAGREVEILIPDEIGTDFNDIAQEMS